MSTDRELLEMAAKAAGMEDAAWNNGLGGMVTVFNQEPWNPLTDDGDALRLASTLGMNVDMTPGKFVEASIFLDDKRISGMCDCGPAPDYYAATRLAIVRAAAAIGKDMP